MGHIFRATIMVTLEVENNLSIQFSVVPNNRVWSLVVHVTFQKRRDEIKWEEPSGFRLTHASRKHILRQSGSLYYGHSSCGPDPWMSLDLATQLCLDKL